MGEASPKAQQLLGVLQGFMEAHVYPAESILEEHAMGDNRWVKWDSGLFFFWGRLLQGFMEAHVYPAESTLDEHAMGVNR